MSREDKTLPSLTELHDRLGSMIDQVGHPDYSLRELCDGLRGVRDDLLAISSGAAQEPVGWMYEGIAPYVEGKRIIRTEEECPKNLYPETWRLLGPVFALPECAEPINAAGHGKHRADAQATSGTAAHDPATVGEAAVNDGPARAPAAPSEGPTPRTDELLHERRMAERASGVWDVEDVEAFLKHARQLERELARAHAERIRNSVALHDMTKRAEAAERTLTRSASTPSKEAVDAAKQWEHLEVSGGLPITHPAFKICVKEILRLAQCSASTTPTDG